MGQQSRPSVLSGYQSVIISQEGVKAQLLFPICGLCMTGPHQPSWQLSSCISTIANERKERQAEEMGVVGLLGKSLPKGAEVGTPRRTWEQERS